MRWVQSPFIIDATSVKHQKMNFFEKILGGPSRVTMGPRDPEPSGESENVVANQ
jgi:hypothetical protein